MNCYSHAILLAIVVIAWAIYVGCGGLDYQERKYDDYDENGESDYFFDAKAYEETKKTWRKIIKERNKK